MYGSPNVAECLLFPVAWEEPFGLVMVEAMACGTPVLALRKGAVPEVLRGFPQLICRSLDEMARKVEQRRFPAPEALRRYVKRRFTNAKMTDGYLKVYRQVLSSWERTTFSGTKNPPKLCSALPAEELERILCLP
ncbi:glycosyltransferase [Paenibacillus xerothermodurans]|uniref:glycosyltransferase n=1 Tax=Paenibacillus xerothermodurans TaxID=1977292 RepID=UPI003C7570D2